jgi:uncharacterized repeat protein (TIGR03803 family)
MHAESGSSALARGLYRAALCSAVGLSLVSPALATDQIVYAFKGLAPGSSDPYQPEYGLVKGPDGKLYGTSRENGDGNQSFGKGVIFQITLRNNHPAIKRLIYKFKGGTRGSLPEGPLVFDNSGNAYGTTPHGGHMNDCQTQGCGTVFKLSPPISGTGKWTSTIIHRFSNAGGSSPKGALTFDSAGNLYGATWYGGGDNYCTGDVGGCGVIYRLSPPSSGVLWDFKVLHKFQHLVGAVPNGGMIFDQTESALYGTAEGGGTSSLDGVVFRLKKPAPGHTKWVYTDIYNFIFHNDNADGSQPQSGLVFDASGNLYGTTQFGGNLVCNSFAGCGTVFKLAPSGNSWIKSNLHVFAGGSDGRNPFSSLTIDGAGNLYGTTSSGGGAFCGVGCGTVYKLEPNGGSFNYSILHSFQGGANDGSVPHQATLLWDGSTKLYGTTTSGGAASDPAGTVYSITLP